MGMLEDCIGVVLISSGSDKSLPTELKFYVYFTELHP